MRETNPSPAAQLLASLLALPHLGLTSLVVGGVIAPVITKVLRLQTYSHAEEEVG